MTTILAVRHKGRVALGGDGQVTNGARHGADLQATQLAGAADEVRETATRTLRGIETQRPLLTKAMQETRGVSASLRESADQAAGLATSTEQIASSVNEHPITGFRTPWDSW